MANGSTQETAGHIWVWRAHEAMWYRLPGDPIESNAPLGKSIIDCLAQRVLDEGMLTDEQLQHSFLVEAGGLMREFVVESPRPKAVYACA